MIRERKDRERESSGTLFGSHLQQPMGLNVLGYQSHLGIVAIRPVSGRILPKVISYVPYFIFQHEDVKPNNTVIRV